MSNNVQTINAKGSGTSTITITGLTNATFKQRVAAQIKGADGSYSQEFNGNGEGVSFSEHWSHGVELPATIELTFTYSSDGGRTYNPAKRSQQVLSYSSPTIEIYTVTSEDATDGDDNDTIMTVSIHKHS